MAQVYCHEAAKSYANSLVALCDATRPLHVDPLSLLERIYLGGTSGEPSLFAEIRRVPPGRVIHLRRDGTVQYENLELQSWHSRPRSFDDAVEDARSRLVRLFEIYRTIRPGNIITPLTGGYDSRLTVAAFRAIGENPRLLVYGQDTDADVAIAKRIATAEGLEIDHLDKSLHPEPKPADYPELIEESFVIHDGRGITGIFGNGSDIPSRRRRASGDALYLNGGGGEIYRNYWMLRDARIPLDAFIRHRYERIERSTLRDPSDWHRMLARVTSIYAGLVGVRDGWLDRAQMDALYVLQRIRYWMTPDNQVNNLFGPSVLPFSEPLLTEASIPLPVAWREDGRFEAALITRLDPRLASYPSSYGWSFDRPIPFKKKLRTWLKQHTPAFLRQRYQRRHMARRSGLTDLPFWATDPWREGILGEEPLRIGEQVDVEGIRDPRQLNRALTAELMLRRYT